MFPVYVQSLSPLFRRLLHVLSVDDVPKTFHLLIDTGTHQHFDMDLYSQHLKTNRLGRFVAHAPLLPSTIDLANHFVNLQDTDGVLVTSRRQLAGRGRGSATWEGPEGCAMFSVIVRCFPRPSLLQHLMAVALVDAARELGGNETGLRIKWPNDVYWGTHKIAGTLAHAVIQGRESSAVLSCGVNVSNPAPTTCLKDVLHLDLHIEHVLAVILNQLEERINKFQLDTFLRDYYAMWMHHEQRLTTAQGEVVVRGIDEFGFLLVEESQTGKQLTLAPDSNSLDMMNNMIVIKK